jgi:hypothetical protein
VATTRPDRRRLNERAHEAAFLLAQIIWLPAIETVGSYLYQRALARSKRMKRERVFRVTEPR